MTDAVRTLDPATLAFFAEKGLKGGRGIPVGAGEANAARVRRVMQVTQDLAGVPMRDLKVLDLACGEGVFAIEAALKGAQVLAVDGRTVRMQEGIKIAERLGLTNLRFEQADVREIAVSSHGQFDIIYAMGILYHLDVGDNFTLLRNIYGMCRHFVVIDTSVAPDDARNVEYDGRGCAGLRIREHDNADSNEIRHGRPLASLDNAFSFQFTTSSLCSALREIGFTSVFQCFVPLEPTKPEARVTTVAVKGASTAISTYPWINGMSEGEIAWRLHDHEERVKREYFQKRSGEIGPAAESVSGAGIAKRMLNGMLSAFNLEIRRRDGR